MRLSPLYALALCLFAPITGSAADEEDAELKRIAGRFERQFRDAAGNIYRSVRDVQGTQSVVTTYGPQGNVVEAHSSVIKVEKRGPVRVLSFFNSVVTAGPRQGATPPGPHAYIYRLEGDTFTETWGLLEGDDSPPRMFQWKRVAEP